MKRIILGYDASRSAERALRRVIELAREFDSRVVVASVAPVHEYALRGNGMPGPTDVHADMAKDATARLTEHGVKARPVTGFGPTASTLVELADATGADLIVLGMSSRDLIARFAGGVSDGVVHAAHCDVLLVH